MEPLDSCGTIIRQRSLEKILDFSTLCVLNSQDKWSISIKIWFDILQEAVVTEV